MLPMRSSQTQTSTTSSVSSKWLASLGCTCSTYVLSNAKLNKKEVKSNTNEHSMFTSIVFITRSHTQKKYYFIKLYLQTCPLLVSSAHQAGLISPLYFLSSMRWKLAPTKSKVGSVDDGKYARGLRTLVLELA